MDENGACLIVTVPLEAGGLTLRPGDVVPLQFRSLRLAALARPEAFRVQRPPEPVDVEWLTETHRRYEAEYREAQQANERRRLEAQKAGLAASDGERKRSKSLESRFARQEAEKAEVERERQAERERQRVEMRLRRETGFHFQP